MEQIIRFGWCFGKYSARKIIILVTAKRLVKTQIFEKKASLPVKNIYRSIFSRFVDYNKTQGTTWEGPQGILTFIVQKIGSFLLDLKGR